MNRLKHLLSVEGIRASYFSEATDNKLHTKEAGI